MKNKKQKTKIKRKQKIHKKQQWKLSKNLFLLNGCIYLLQNSQEVISCKSSQQQQLEKEEMTIIAK